MSVDSSSVAQNTTLIQSVPLQPGSGGGANNPDPSESQGGSLPGTKTMTGGEAVESAQQVRQEAQQLAADRGNMTMDQAKLEAGQLDRKADQLEQVAGQLEYKAKVADNLANILSELPGRGSESTKELQQSLREASANMKEDAKSIREDVKEIRRQVYLALRGAVHQRTLIGRQNDFNSERTMKTREKEKEKAAEENEKIFEQRRLHSVFAAQRRANSLAGQNKLGERLEINAALSDIVEVRLCQGQAESLIETAKDCDSIPHSNR